MKVLVIIPAYNEAGSIGSVLRELRQTAPEYDCVVVNDGSTDGTAAECRAQGARVLELPDNLGLAGAVQAGMRYACKNGYDAAVQIDADGQHDPRFISALAAKMEETDADLVIGSRFLQDRRPCTLRMSGNALLSAVTRLTTGRWISDPTSGMRLYGKKLLKLLAYGVNYGPEPDTVAYLIRSGARVEEVPIRMRDRIAGQSYLSPFRSVLYMLRMCMNICFIQWFRKRSDFACRQ